MKRFVLILLCLALFLSGCTSNSQMSAGSSETGPSESVSETALIPASEIPDSRAEAEVGTPEGHEKTVKTVQDYIDMLTLLPDYLAEQEERGGDAYYGLVYDEPVPTESQIAENQPIYNLYDYYLAAADDAQKAELKKLQNANPDKTMFYVRKMKMIMGELPPDQPRLSLAETEEIWEQFCIYCNSRPEEAMRLGDASVLQGMLNEVAGAPDVVGGNGLYYWIYYLNESETEMVDAPFGSITYYRKDPHGIWESRVIGSPSEDLAEYYEAVEAHRERAQKEHETVYLTNYPDDRYEKASPEQKSAMDEAYRLLCRRMGTTPEDSQTPRLPERDIQMIIGELPQDTPRLTLAQIMEIVEEVENDPAFRFTSGIYYKDLSALAEAFAEEFRARFDAIAGAPDIYSAFRRGSVERITAYRYYLADNEEWYLCVENSLLKLRCGEQIYKVAAISDMFVEP